MVGALWTGISGLGGAQVGLDNESNNIANVNTIGYKASRVSFTDQMYQAKIGKGVTSFDVEKMFTQGNLKLTGVSYDVGLSGDGFFQVSNGSEKFYTRAGNFRMGESGTLEDVAKNKVQGWAVSEITDDNRKATDPNATKFTNAYSELLGNKIIRDSTTIETIIAKATDYNATATSDSQTIHSGAGYKTASTKISDIELLVSEYNKLLTTHSNADPKPTASSSSVQQSYMNFGLDGVSMAQGDEMYVYIDGVKYTQSFDTDEATTIKKFADVLSNTAGFKAHYTDGIENNPTGTVKEGSYAYDNAKTNPKGGIYLEGIIPGTSFKITEFGWTDASNSNQATKGEVKTIQEAVQGTGMGAIESVENALSQAVSGKQQDVYTPSDIILSSTTADNDFTYQINIYDKETKTNVTVPGTALIMDDVVDIDAMVKAINTVADPTGKAINTELAYYVKAYNINGNLVVKTLDTNNDVEFTGELKGPIPEQQIVKVTGNVDLAEHQTVAVAFVGAATQAAGPVDFLGTTVSGTALGDSVETVIDKIISDKDNLITAWNNANPLVEIDDLIKDDAGTIQIVYKHSEGDVAAVAIANSNDIGFTTTDDVQAYSTAAAGFRFLGSAVANIADGDSTSTVVEKIVADKTAIMGVWNLANPTAQISDIIKVSSDEIKLVYNNVMGDVSIVSSAQGYGDALYGVKFADSEEIIKGELKGLISRNINFSGREGAGAEFLQMTTTISQTSSKSDIQLRLDSLMMTDSAFGEYSVDETGMITMKQDGTEYAVGQIAVAKFTDNRGLNPVGDNLYEATNRSGTALFNINNDKTADVKGGSLELSTSDLSQSLVNLMVFQKAFEANAKSITTADQILTTLIQLKR